MGAVYSRESPMCKIKIMIMIKIKIKIMIMIMIYWPQQNCHAPLHESAEKLNVTIS